MTQWLLPQREPQCSGFGWPDAVEHRERRRQHASGDDADREILR